ncbi:ribosome biogenesis protein WDR12 homolog isoform X2 [Tubulanus polymorphus]|uniref:ribosome biogenesis protein WDR12 homolog isoform X2 n=1 Tax=Tubulanus polymorphus TaxID=672921 RepID=UPI003DA643C3
MAASTDQSNIAHVQVKFFTKQEQYSVPDDPFSVPSNVTINELSDLINGLIKQGSGEGRKVSFDFLIDGEFLRSSLQEYIENSGKSTEAVLDVEFLEREAAPSPEDSLQHDDWVSCVEGSNSFILSGCYDNTVKIWNTNGDNLVTIPGHTAPVKCLAWVEQDEESATFVTGSHDQVLLRWHWNPKTNSVKCLTQCKGHAGSIECVAVSPQKTRFCSGSWDALLKIWNTDSSDSTNQEADGDEHTDKKRKSDHKVSTQVPVMTFSGHKESISSARWLDDKDILTASWDHTMKIWDLHEGCEKSTLNGVKVFLDISYSTANKMVLSASADRHIRLWDPRNEGDSIVTSTFTSHTGWVTSVSWSQHNPNLFISGSYDSVLKLWDVRSPKAPMYDMTGHEDRVLCTDWSIPDLMLSGGADNHLKIFKHSQK